MGGLKLQMVLNWGPSPYPGFHLPHSFFSEKLLVFAFALEGVPGAFNFS